MAKIFNNINKDKFPIENINLSGWERTTPYDADRIAHITDTVGAGMALAKMGTSIPTPFARIILFRTAFEMVNGSHDHDDQSAYGKLVSECLDFLEFIFNNERGITVKAWNVTNNIQALKKSGSKGHRELGNSLENFALDLGVKDIYLIYYSGKLIGGTSPYTIVYTSPNWQRSNPTAGAHGLAGNRLFPDYSNPNVKATPLHERDDKFQVMLTRFYVAFEHILGNVGQSGEAFFKYIYDNQNDYSEKGAKEAAQEYIRITGPNLYTANNFTNDYNLLKENDAAIDLLGKGGEDAIYLPTQKASPVDNTVNEDYKIVPTVNRNGLASMPLVLTESGITGALYVSNSPMQANMTIDRDPSIALTERMLPGGFGIKYPYLTDADFFQEKIIKVPYKVNDDNFYTLGKISCQDGDYLLPLRKEIFDYFSPEDFGKVKNLSLTIIEKDQEHVEAVLRIPVKCQTQGYIDLKHTYDKTNIVELMVPPESFSVAVFPSYKILSDKIPNLYSILVDDDNQSISTAYYELNDTSIDKVEIAHSHKRLTNGSRYEELEHAFDLIELESEGCTALLLPKFVEVTPSAGGGNTVVGIDFGTTNTYICYSTQNGGSPHSVDITKEDMQVLTLNKIDLSNGDYGDKYINSMSSIYHFAQALDREYVPLLLGKESNVKYPFRTVTCETSEFVNEVNVPQLFAEINIGYNFFNETFELGKDEKYNTEIKWEIESGKGDDPIIVKENRVKAYTLETAWIIKSKLMLLDNPVTQFSVFLTFPHTMSHMTQNLFEEFWKDAFAKVMGDGNVSIFKMTESIAPYYSLISNQGGNYSENALNIDIGGGTTDMLFADVENKTFYFDSSKFAGDDLWGDGLHLITQYNKDNGFVTDFESNLRQNSITVSQERKEGYDKYKQTVKKSSDLMSYIFRYESDFRYTSIIRQSKDKFLPILCVHAAAIVYHVAQVLVEKKITIPTTITFSGMGAQYLKIISDRSDDVQEIVWHLLSTFMESLTGNECQKPRDFVVMFQNNAKEVTAQGAMLYNHTSLQSIRDYAKEPLCIYGFDEAPSEIEYRDAMGYKDKVLAEYEKFLDTFFGSKKLLRFFQDYFGIIIDPSLEEVFKTRAGDSFNDMTRSAANPADVVKETMFFWPLKNRIYEATKLAAKPNNKK